LVNFCEKLKKVSCNTWVVKTFLSPNTCNFKLNIRQMYLNALLLCSLQKKRQHNHNLENVKILIVVNLLSGNRTWRFNIANTKKHIFWRYILLSSHFLRKKTEPFCSANPCWYWFHLQQNSFLVIFKIQKGSSIYSKIWDLLNSLAHWLYCPSWFIAVHAANAGILH